MSMRRSRRASSPRWTSFLGADDKAFVMDELRAKLDVDAVAGAAATPEEAAEIYTASPAGDRRRQCRAPSAATLAMLAARLKLDDALVAQPPRQRRLRHLRKRRCRSRPGHGGGERYSAANRPCWP